MIVVDDRTPEEKKRTNYIIVATDNFLSGWGMAEDGNSYFAVACETWEQRKKAIEVLNSRPEMIRVREVLPSYRPNSAYCAHYRIGWFEKLGMFRKMDEFEA